MNRIEDPSRLYSHPKQCSALASCAPVSSSGRLIDLLSKAARKLKQAFPNAAIGAGPSLALAAGSKDAPHVGAWTRGVWTMKSPATSTSGGRCWRFWSGRCQGQWSITFEEPLTRRMNCRDRPMAAVLPARPRDVDSVVNGTRSMALLAKLFALSCALSLSGCGGEVAELLTKQITARFVPSQTTVAAGSTRTVELEVICSFAGLESPFGRLALNASLARGGNLPPGVTAALVGGDAPSPPVPGYRRFRCTDPHPDPALRVAHIPVQITAAPGTAAQVLSLLAYVEIEPLRDGEPPKDATTATLDVVVTAAPTANSDANFLLDPGFEQLVAAGGMPSLAGVWQGDATNTVPAEGGIAPHGGARMLKFIATGQQATANLVSSQMWQIVDLQAWSTAIDAGGVSVDASAWFNRVTGGPNTDRRFDLRVLAFDTTDAGVPMRYQANGALAVQAASVNTTGAAWQQASLSMVLPPLTRVVLVEIYAYEDVLNDAVAPEFDGHYADDVMLQLRLP